MAGVMMAINTLVQTGKNLSEQYKELQQKYGYFYPDKAGADVKGVGNVFDIAADIWGLVGGVVWVWMGVVWPAYFACIVWPAQQQIGCWSVYKTHVAVVIGKSISIIRLTKNGEVLWLS
jgi:hypothetical protein